MEKAFPDWLRGESNAVQLLYMWLEVQGEVRYSIADVSELVRLGPDSVRKALNRLTEIGVLNVVKKPTLHRKGIFKILAQQLPLPISTRKR